MAGKSKCWWRTPRSSPSKRYAERGSGSADIIRGIFGRGSTYSPIISRSGIGNQAPSHGSDEWSPRHTKSKRGNSLQTREWRLDENRSLNESMGKPKWAHAEWHGQLAVPVLRPRFAGGVFCLREYGVSTGAYPRRARGDKAAVPNGDVADMNLQRPNPGGIGKCKCGHPQPKHGYTKAEEIGLKIGRTPPLSGHGKCLARRCKCTKYTYVGWMEP